ncbi:hypothetical protein S83_065940, partial [Arachis hypogaea]
NTEQKTVKQNPIRQRRISAAASPCTSNSSFVAPLVYAFMGTSRDIAIRLVAVVSLLLGSLLSSEISDTKSHYYVRLALTATFFAGVTKFGTWSLQ